MSLRPSQLAKISEWLKRNFERFDYGDADYYCFMFDEAVIHFGNEIEALYYSETNRNKEGKYIKELGDFLKDPDARTGKRYTPINEVKQKFFRVSGIEVE